MRAEEQALMESVGRKSGRLELEWAVNRAEIVEKCRIPGRAGSTKDKMEIGGLGGRRRMKQESKKKVMKMLKMRML